MLREFRRNVDGEREPCSHARAQDGEVRLGQSDLLAERRRARAKLRQRGAQVSDEVPEQAGACRGRVRLGEVLHGRQRVEQEVRLDLRLHQLQFRLDRLLGQQVPVGLGPVQRRRPLRLAVLHVEEEADEEAARESGEHVPRERVRARGDVFERVPLDPRSRERDTDERADQHGDREAQDRPRLVSTATPRRRSTRSRTHTAGR